MIRTPRIVIAGTHSGVGKTTIATALIAALTRRGLRVQPFKIGPDFIDPGFHEVASGRVSRNLDGWMLSRQANLEIFGRACADADVAVIEGAMGLFDGRSPTAEDGSTAEMAKWLEAPVLLVADASAMARSAAALLGGFEAFDTRLDLAGVLFNRIGGKKHADLLRESVARYCRSTPLGFLPRDEKIAMPSRHLGLQMACEALTPECLAGMVAWIEANVDLDRLLRLAREHSPEHEILLGPPMSQSQKSSTSSNAGETACATTANPPLAELVGQSFSLPGLLSRVRKARIGIARDAAFCFYYRDNLDLLASYGAELVEFSPIADRELPPEIDGLYLGGGYPEIHAAQLAENQAMLQAIRSFAEAGAPVYAECGGFMYLTEAIVETGGQEHTMAGIFPTRARMQSRLAALGYIQPEPAGNSLWLHAGESLRGHQFRYSAMDPMPAAVARVYQSPAEGYRMHSILGSYIHLHFLSCPGFAKRFVEHCAQGHARI